MKLFIPLLAISLFLVRSGAESQDCNSYYSRQIANSYVTWNFDDNTHGARYTGDNDYIDPDDVRVMIQNAIAKWCAAANQEGTRITFAEVEGDAWMNIRFVSLAQGECGQCEVPQYPELNYNFRFAGYSELETTILHEIGHAFLGSGHHGDGVMSDYVGSNCNAKQTFLGQCESGRVLELYNPTRTVIVRNDFGDAGLGGLVKVDGEGGIPSPSTNYWREGGGSHSFETYRYQDQEMYGPTYTFKYTKWENKDNQTVVSDPTIYFAHATTRNEIYSAFFTQMYDVTFETSPSGLQLKVRDTIRTDGFTAKVLSTASSITAEGIYNESQRIAYSFNHWMDLSTTNPRSFYQSDHASYTAYYSPKPLPPPYVSAGGTVGDYVHLSWQSHPSELVTEFKIWRKVKPKNQNERSPVLIATVSSSTTSYIDYDYTVTNGYTDDLVSYDVRSSMSYDGSTIYSDPSYVAVFAEIAPKIAVNMPVDFNIEAFPNPFNPSTRILYSLKHAGDLRLTIVDVTGREVATLKSGYQAEGRQSIVWNGTNMAGFTVGSGVYFARMVVTGEDGSAVYENTIRLLLTK